MLNTDQVNELVIRVKTAIAKRFPGLSEDKFQRLYASTRISLYSVRVKSPTTPPRWSVGRFVKRAVKFQAIKAVMATMESKSLSTIYIIQLP